MYPFLLSTLPEGSPFDVYMSRCLAAHADPSVPYLECCYELSEKDWLAWRVAQSYILLCSLLSNRPGSPCLRRATPVKGISHRKEGSSSCFPWKYLFLREHSESTMEPGSVGETSLKIFVSHNYFFVSSSEMLEIASFPRILIRKHSLYT